MQQDTNIGYKDNMNLLENVSIEFSEGVLNVHQNGSHLVHQPYNSYGDARQPFASREEAISWLESHYPGFFQTPQQNN